MCLVFFTFGCGPPHPHLLLAFNRDEYCKRPTQPLHFWRDNDGVLAGRDLGSGGTWLGVQVHKARVAFLTNLRARDPLEPSNAASHVSGTPACASRGELVTQFLSGTSSPEDYLQSIPRDRYHGFNLVVGDLSTDPRVGAFAYTNNAAEEGCSPATAGGPGLAALQPQGEEEEEAVEGPMGQSGRSGHPDQGTDSAAVAVSVAPAGPSGSTPPVQLLEPGRVYGLSNGRLMEWPKVTSGLEVFGRLLPDVVQGREVPYDRIFSELLGDSRRLVPMGAKAANANVAASVAGGAEGSTPGPRPADTNAHRGEDVVLEAAAEVAAEAGGGAAAHQAPAEVPTESQVGAVQASQPSQVGADGATTVTTLPSSPAGGGAGGRGDAVGPMDAATFAALLEHITSGRFVTEVQSPYGPYGTRSQTVVVVWHDGSGEARERHRGDDGSWAEVAVPFSIGAPATAGR